MKTLMASCPVEHRDELSNLIAAVPEKAQRPVRNLIQTLLASGLTWRKVLTIVSGELPVILAAFGLELPAAVMEMIQAVIASALANSVK